MTPPLGSRGPASPTCQCWRPRHAGSSAEAHADPSAADTAPPRGTGCCTSLPHNSPPARAGQGTPTRTSPRRAISPPAPASTTPTGSTSDRPTSPRGHSRSPSSWGAAPSVAARLDQSPARRSPRWTRQTAAPGSTSICPTPTPKPGTSGTWRRWSTSTLPTAPRRPASGLIRSPGIWCSRWTGEPGAGSESWTVCATGSASGGWFTEANNEPHGTRQHRAGYPMVVRVAGGPVGAADARRGACRGDGVGPSPRRGGLPVSPLPPH